MAADELVQVVDEHDSPLDGLPIAVIRRKGLWHRVARVMIDDGQGNILLQQRTLDNGLFPGRWDNSAAGVVDKDEPYDVCAVRELAEEVGISNVPLTEIGSFASDYSYKDKLLKEWQKVYRATVPADSKLNLQTSEVHDAKWFLIAEAKKMAHDHPEQMTNGLKEVLRRYY